MKYRIKEIFYTLQCEGANSGVPAVFVRFSGCNLWNGLESGRSSDKRLCSNWCDTDFLGGDKLSAEEVVVSMLDCGEGCRFAVLTGGEPALQVDEELISMISGSGYTIAIETNGTSVFPDVDWVSLSPKSGAVIAIEKANEVRVVHPSGVNPLDYSSFPSDFKYVSPLDASEENIEECIKFCKENTTWRLSVQSQKIIGIR